MTARTGMAEIINHVRALTNAGTADYTIASVTYWSDDETQRILDDHRVDFYRQPLGKIQQYEGGAVVCKVYDAGFGFIESGDVFELEDSVGNTVGTALYTLDARRGKITFASDTGGSIYYITGRTYQTNIAAADIWRMKAANVAAYYDFSTDNHKMSRSQMMKHCLDMASHFEAQEGAMVVDMYRSDDVI